MMMRSLKMRSRKTEIFEVFEAMAQTHELKDSSSSVQTCQSETHPAAEQWIHLPLRVAT